MLAVLAEAALRSFLLGGAVWLGLTGLRVTNPHVQKAAWIVVLAASLSMPLLMHWAKVPLTVQPPPVAAQEALTPSVDALLEPLLASPISQGENPAQMRGPATNTIDGWVVAGAIYALGAGLLLLRIAFGLVLMRRIVRDATPVRARWAKDVDARLSDDVSGPVVFGSVVLLPAQAGEWDAQKREAVLAHEKSHIAGGDFYLLLLASLNRAVFWFSPFAWWQLRRLTELAEIVADARAIEALEDRMSYAELLLELVQGARPLPAAVQIGLEMARASMMPARIDRILAATTLPPKVGWRKRLGIAAAVSALAIGSAMSIVTRMAPVAAHALASTPATDAPTPQHKDFYALGPTAVFILFGEGSDLFGQMTGQPRLRLATLKDGTLSYSAGVDQITFALDGERPSELTLHQNGHDLHAGRITTTPRATGEADPALLDQYVGFYQVTAYRVLSVTRNGDRLHLRETGQAELDVTASGNDAFSGGEHDLIIFLRDDRGAIEQVLLDDLQSGARRAPRIEAGAAKTIEDAFARRVAEVPDRFREQAPAPGTKDALLRGIADLQNGTPQYDRMSPQLAAKIRRQASDLHTVLVAFGKVESVFFRGVGPGGYDIYGVKFANGSADFRLLLDADGKVDDVYFQPNGNDRPGGVVDCSAERSLKSEGAGAAIRILIENETGGDIQLYNLDADGNRAAHGMIADHRSTVVWTSVNSPWIVADRSGQCLEIVLPGQRTRYHTVATSHISGPARSTPLAGTEDMLRQYIDGLSRGQPNYDRMSADVAAQTRQALPFDQAILTRLGELRALSFRGVTALGSDIYMAHFANGTAEWRISLAENGSITRIVLGPQN
jgi:beta-lactamase regulating signal transducer with metallopeptidase domain